MKKLITIILILAMLMPAAGLADDLYSLHVHTGENTSYVLNILKTDKKIYVLGFEFDLDTNGYHYTVEGNNLVIPMDDGTHFARVENNRFIYQISPGGQSVTTYLAADSSSDISDMTNDELIELNHQIQLRLFSEQLVNGVKIPAGIYTVGVDFPAGTYRIEYMPKSDTSFISLLAYNQDPFMQFSTILGYTGSNEIGKLELPDGAYFEVDGDVYFYAYSGLFN